MCRRISRKFAALTALATALFGLAVIASAPPAQAYNVCTDDGQPCTHEHMSLYGLQVLDDADAEAWDYSSDIWTGAGHEDGDMPGDVDDHIYGIPYHLILGPAIVTMTHFWDADPGDNTPSTYGNFEGPVDIVDTSFIVTENALQKARYTWSLAVGSYANGDKAKAYEYLGHIVHFLGDMTVPTHAHGDAHVDLFNDHDPYEEWMSYPSGEGDGGGHMFLSPSELQTLKDAPPLEDAIPAGVDPLYYLLYTTNQLSDFFASRDVDGDTFDRHGWVQARLDQMAVDFPSPRIQDHLDDNDDDDGPFGEEINNNDGDLSDIRSVTYMYGIRAIAALYRHFERTVQEPTLSVLIEQVHDSDDDADTLDDADFYGKVAVNNWWGMNRGEEAVDTETVNNPGWAYGAAVAATGNVPVHIEIWDEDGESPLVPSLNGPDDLIDIDGQGSDGDKTIDLTVDMAKCISGEPGAISGDFISACGQTIETEGDHDPLIGDSERAKVRFRLITDNPPPVADAGPDRTTVEGTNTILDGTGSRDPDGGPLTYAWDLDGDGDCDDATGATPTFDRVGQDGTTTVKLCVTDSGGLTDDDTAIVTVTNVAPGVSVSSPAPISENTSVSVAGTVTDPGWLDPLTATVDWGDGTGIHALTGTLENSRPDATFGYSASRTYGDNGTYTIQVCGSDDDTSTCSSTSVTVSNVAPTATIDDSSAQTYGGQTALILPKGDDLAVPAEADDPGSDDLTFTWDWDGPSASNETPTSKTSLVNPPDADPALSPSVQPRVDVQESSTHAYGEACVYDLQLTVTDDDGGSVGDAIKVIVTGDSDKAQGHGWWLNAYRPKGTEFTAAELQCYLDIVNYFSVVFSEGKTVTTRAEATKVLNSPAKSPADVIFDQTALGAWLNFANGAVTFGTAVDSDGDGILDSTWGEVMYDAETVRMDPSSTSAEIKAARTWVTRIALSTHP